MKQMGSLFAFTTRLLWAGILLLAVVGTTSAQTTLLNDPAGQTYGNSDGPTGPDVYSVDVSTCTSVSFTLDYSFNQSWSGSGNMESADECPFGPPNCAGDPNFPEQGSCPNCWDFLWANFNLDGFNVGGDLIGEAGTTDAEQNGTIALGPICTNGATMADITVVTQTWAASEAVTFNNIMIVCWEAAPTISSNSPLCTAGQTLTLDGSAVDNSAVVSWQWTNTGSGVIANPTAQNTTASSPQNGETYTLTTTDPNGCTATDMITVIVGAGMPPNPASATACDDGSGQATFNLLDLNNTVNGGSGQPVTWYFDMPGTSPIGSPGSFTTASITVYATVGAGSCESSTVAVPLNVLISPTATPTSASACDDGTGQATFDLTLLDGTVDATGSNTVIWTTDMAGNNPIGTPTMFVTSGTTVYATVSDGTCSSSPVPVVLTVDPAPSASPTTATGCDDGSGTFTFDLTALDGEIDLTGLYTVNWYSDIAGTSPIVPANSYPSGGEVVYATVTDGICESLTVGVLLIVGPLPIANSTSINACDDGSGQALFDLTASNQDVNGNTGNMVNWYTDPAGSFPIGNPGAYLSSGEIVYAAVNDGNCQSIPVAVVLIVDPAPDAFPASDDACDDGSGQALFDLTTLNAFVSPSGDIVTWYDDPGATSMIGTPTDYLTFSTTVYAVTDNGICQSAPVPVNLNVIPAPDAFSTTDDACDDGSGQAIFDLTALEPFVSPSGNIVSWYDDPAATSMIGTPTDYLTSTTTVYAVTNDGICSSVPVPVDLNVIPAPIAFPTSDDACDNGSGQALFDLTTLDPLVSPSGNIVSWYDDPAATSMIGSPTDYLTGTTTVYAVTNDGFCSSLPVPVDLNVIPAPDAFSTSDDLCDDGSGQALFDLTTLDPLVSPSGNIVSWYDDPAATSMIGSPTDYLTGTTTVYAVTNDGFCSSLPVPVDLNVIPAPDAFMALADACDDGSGQAVFDLTQLDAIVSGGVAGTVVTWYSDMAGTVIGAPGSYPSSGGTVYASVFDGNCNSGLVEITLTVNAGSPDINETYNGCSGDGYSYTSPSGIVYNEGNPTGNEVLQDLNDCDYNVNVNLVFNAPTPDINETYNGCSGDGYSYTSPSGIVYNEGNPTGNEVLQDLNDCDYNVNVNLVFNAPTPDINETYNGCSGDGYSYTSPSGIVYNEGNPTGNEVLQDLNDCDYNVNVNLVFNAPTPDINETYNGCSGDNYSYVSPSGIVYNEGNPTGNEVLQDANDCDYNVNVNLVFNAATADINETYIGCSGDGYSYTSPSGIVYNEGNPTGNEVLQDINNCDYNVNVNLVFNAPTPDINETYNGCSGDGYSYTSPSGIVYNEGNPNGNEVLQDANDCDYNVNVNLVFNTLPLAATASDLACDEGGGQATFDLTDLEGTILGGGAGTSVNWYQDDMGQIPITGTTAYQTGNTTIYATVSDGLCESETVAIVLTVAELPSFSNLTDDCLPSNADYEVVFEINGGSAPYTVTGDAGTLTGNMFTSSPIPVGDSYSFSITDANGCGPIEVTGANLQCNCATSAGDMDLELINVCEDELISATHLGGEFLDFDDLLVYVLHDNAGNTLGTIYETNSTPDFDLSMIGGLMPNTTYYISAVAGNDNGFGIIDLTDICLSVAQGTPFIIQPIPTADISVGDAICENSCYDLTIALSGTAPFNIDYTIDHPINGVQNISIQTNDNFYIITTCSDGLQAGEITVNVNAVEDNFCEGNTLNDAATVTVIPDANSTFTGPLCNGQSVNINGTIYNMASPTGTEVLSGEAFNGCDSIVTVDLQFTSAVTGEELYVGCEGDGYSVMVGSTVYDQNTPNGMETLASSAGCDSIVTIDLDFLTQVTGSELYTGCEGDGYSVTVNGNVYDQLTPNGQETLLSSLGCDSIVTINLDFNIVTSGTENYTGCSGDGYSVVVGGAVFDEVTPTGVITLNGSNNCDSTVVIDLVFQAASTGEETYTGCNGDGYSVMVGGNVYDEATPTGTEMLLNSVGCDSTVTINLSFDSSVTGEELYEGCVGDGYSVMVNGNTYDEGTPTGTETLISTGGCDSIVSINLMYNTALAGVEEYEGCENDGYAVMVNGNTYDQNTPIGSETLASSLGCDSIVSINLVFNAAVTGDELYEGCIGDGYAVLVNGNIYNEATPIGTETLQGLVTGCDSIVSINLSYSDQLMGEETYEGCIGDGYEVMVGGVPYNEANPTGTATLVSSIGCDSVVSINLSFTTELTGEELYVGCEGDGYSVQVGGSIYDQSNPTGSATINSTAGCDSVVTINLVFNEILSGNEDYVGCMNDGYTVLVGGNIYNETTPVGMETLTTVDGCDSIVSINLVYQSPSSGNELYSGCAGDNYSVMVNGTVYDESLPSGTEILTNYLGCDSVVTIDLEYAVAVFGNEDYDGCVGDGYEVIVGGVPYNEGNPTGSETILSASGCDSIVSIDLNFNIALAGAELYEGCAGDGYVVTVNGNTYDEATPSGTETLQSSIGCDSIVSINLVFNAATQGQESYSGCIGDGYSVMVNGTTYDESSPTGTENIVGGNYLGCDSMVVIALEFDTQVEFDLMQTLCEVETIEVNGTTYGLSNPSGTEVIAGGSVAGCDSIINVELDFYPSVLYALSQDAFICPGDSVPITFILEGGNNYNVTFDNGGSVINLNNIVNGHTIMVSPSSTTTYSILDAEAIGIPCEASSPTSSITVTVSDIDLTAQVDSDYGGFSVACNGGDNGIASATPIDGTAPFFYSWSNGANSATVENLSGGVYTVTVTDAIGCTAEAQVFLDEPTSIQAGLSSEAPICFGDDDGFITIDTVYGGAGIYSYSIDGDFYQNINAFPVTIPFVESGNYEIYFQDQYDCDLVSTVSVASPQAPALELGSDVSIRLGDSVELDPLTNILVDFYDWNTTIYMSCDTCFNTFTTPMETLNYSLEVSDSLGCSARDDITITVLKPRKVYIPNAFSPNGDGINDYFFIHASREVLQVRTLRIFDRWGEVVYSLDEFQPNDPLLGWQGDLKGEYLNPGVFVYMAEIEFIDGHVEFYQGDVTLVK